MLILHKPRIVVWMVGVEREILTYEELTVLPDSFEIWESWAKAKLLRKSVIDRKLSWYLSQNDQVVPNKVNLVHPSACKLQSGETKGHGTI